MNYQPLRVAHYGLFLRGTSLHAFHSTLNAQLSSNSDIRLTRDLIEAGRHMRVTVHDHVIVGSQGRSSMKAMGLI